MSKYLLIAGLCLTFLAPSALAYVASSSHYRIQADSINFAGDNSSSTNYNIKDTLGETGTGIGTGGVEAVRAGYRPMLESSVSVSAPANITMSPEINGKEADGGSRTADGSGTIKVITDNQAGYLVYIKAATTPALKSRDNSFADYIGGVSWAVADSDSAFGFRVTGTGATSNDWLGFSTNNHKIVELNSANHPIGTDHTLAVRATIGATKKQLAGTYVANLTVTVLPL